jgi:hypothetical protein
VTAARRTVTAIQCVEPGCVGRMKRQDHLAERSSLDCPVCGVSWPAERWPELAERQPVELAAEATR